MENHMSSGPIYPNDRKFSPKKWGWEETLYDGEFSAKVLFIKAGKTTSFHYHPNKDVVIYVQSGMIDVTYSTTDDELKAKKTILSAGDAFHIKPKTRHRFEAVTDAYLHETSTNEIKNDKVKVNP